jgi:hypothetical protein
VPGGKTWIVSYRYPHCEAIDPPRKVTLVASDNSRNTVTPDSDFKGYDQLRVGGPMSQVRCQRIGVFCCQHGLSRLNISRKELVKDGERLSSPV